MCPTWMFITVAALLTDKDDKAHEYGVKKISKDTDIEPEDIIVYESVINIISARYALVPAKL